MSLFFPGLLALSIFSVNITLPSAFDFDVGNKLFASYPPKWAKLIFKVFFLTLIEFRSHNNGSSFHKPEFMEMVECQVNKALNMTMWSETFDNLLFIYFLKQNTIEFWCKCVCLFDNLNNPVILCFEHDKNSASRIGFPTNTPPIFVNILPSGITPHKYWLR